MAGLSKNVHTVVEVYSFTIHLEQLLHGIFDISLELETLLPNPTKPAMNLTLSIHIYPAMGLTSEDPVSPSGGRHTQFKASGIGATELLWFLYIQSVGPPKLCMKYSVKTSIHLTWLEYYASKFWLFLPGSAEKRTPDPSQQDSTHLKNGMLSN